MRRKEGNDDAYRSEKVSEHSEDLVIGNILGVKLCGVIVRVGKCCLRRNISRTERLTVQIHTAIRAERGIVFKRCVAMWAVFHKKILLKNIREGRLATRREGFRNLLLRQIFRTFIIPLSGMFVNSVFADFDIFFAENTYASRLALAEYRSATIVLYECFPDYRTQNVSRIKQPRKFLCGAVFCYFILSV